MTRDELARHLYIHKLDAVASYPAAQGAAQRGGAREWDRGWVEPEEVAECYTRADEMIGNGATPPC